MKHLTPLLLALALLAACDRPQDERCDDLDDLITAKAAALPRACVEDADCALLTVSPALTVATNGASEDPELPAAAQRRAELCPPAEPDRTLYAPACVERRCEALPNGVRPDPDLGADLPDGDACACATSQDCPAGGACLDGCACDQTCQRTCENVDRCGALLTLGLGSSLENCLLRCAATLEEAPQARLPALRCLSNAACDDLLACQP